MGSYTFSTQQQNDITDEYDDGPQNSGEAGDHQGFYYQ